MKKLIFILASAVCLFTSCMSSTDNTNATSVDSSSVSTVVDSSTSQFDSTVIDSSLVDTIK